MPTPEIIYETLHLQKMDDGSVTINGQREITEEQLDMLRALTQKVEANFSKQKLTDVQPDKDVSTTLSHPTEESDITPPEDLQGKNGATHAEPLTLLTEISPIKPSVEENTPTEQQKPCFGNFKQTDMLADILKQTGIQDTGFVHQDDGVLCQQLTLGTDGNDERPQQHDDAQMSTKLPHEYAKPENLPILDVFMEPDQDFEIEVKNIDKIFNQNPFMGNSSVNKACGNVPENDTSEVLNLGNFSEPFTLDNGGNDMGEYRNPPSVSSQVSCTTYTSAMSPQPGEFELLEESGVSMPQRVTGRRGTKRRTSGGKDVKRLMSSASVKSYPTASVRNRKLSRVQCTDYNESIVYKSFWDMVQKVEDLLKWLSRDSDFQAIKVEDLRKYCHDLFAVAIFTPAEWGDKQKRKGIYKNHLKDKYNWDPYVPFCSLNNGPKNGNSEEDAPRAKKDDLVLITPYLIERYINKVRPQIKVLENGQLVPLPPLEDTTSVSNDISQIVPKVEPTDTTVVEPCDFPVTIQAMPNLVAIPTSSSPFQVPLATYGSETTSCIAMETEGGPSTLNLNDLMDVLGPNMLAVNNSDCFDSLNIKPRQTERMATETFPNPEYKAVAPHGEAVKVKLEHNYSIPDDDDIKKVEGVSTYQDSAISGTVVQLPEVNQIPSWDQNDYLVQKMAELFPDQYERVIKAIDTEQQSFGETAVNY